MTITARTASGHAFPIIDPTAADVRWRDVAAHLSKTCRYNGATELFYSVAQHSVIAAEFSTMPRAWDAEDARIFGMAVEAFDVQGVYRAVLVHDGEEFIGGDLIRPMKAALEFEAPGAAAAFGRVLGRVDAAVYAKAGLPWPLPPVLAAAVKRADDRLCATEQRDLICNPAFTFTNGCKPIAMPAIRPVLPGPAEALFLRALEAAGLDPRA